MKLSPPLILRELIEFGRWRHPGQARLSAVAPFITALWYLSGIGMK
jgi:hypothetical protein